MADLVHYPMDHVRHGHQRGPTPPQWPELIARPDRSQWDQWVSGRAYHGGRDMGHYVAAMAFRDRCTIDGGTHGVSSTCYPVVWVTHWVVGGGTEGWHIWFGGQNGRNGHQWVATVGWRWAAWGGLGVNLAGGGTPPWWLLVVVHNGLA